MSGTRVALRSVDAGAEPGPQCLSIIDREAVQ
jgi:hypothetical protein